MKKNNMKWKTIVCAVIFILVSVSVAPSIYADTTPEEEYVEFTTEVCGFPGFKPKTIRLKLKQAYEVETIFENLREQMDSSTSIEKTIQICNNAIVKLDRYGLLGRLSIRQAQSLIMGQFQFFRKKHILDTSKVGLNGDSNSNCLVVGLTDSTMIESLNSVLIEKLKNELYQERPILSAIIFVISFYLYAYENIFKLFFLNGFIRFAGPAEGWVKTYGGKGSISWNGTLYNGFKDSFGFWTAIAGFSGIKITLSFDDGKHFYLGYAKEVGIEYDT